MGTQGAIQLLESLLECPSQCHFSANNSVFIQKNNLLGERPLNSFTLVFTWYLPFSFMDPGPVGAGHREKSGRDPVLLEFSVQLNQRHTQATNDCGLDRISFVKYSHTTRGPQKESGRLCGRLVSHLADKVFPTFMPGEEGAAGLMGGASGQ